MGCGADQKKFEDRFYKTSTSDWKNYLADVGMKDTTLNNSVLLIMRPTACSPCIKELEWWQQNAKKYENTNISLIIIEKYEKTYQTFLNKQQVSLTTYQDSTASILIEELVPTTPIKIYFNNDGKFTAIDNMGAEGDLFSFTDQINNKKPESIR